MSKTNSITFTELMTYKEFNSDLPQELRAFANNLNFKTRKGKQNRHKKK